MQTSARFPEDASPVVVEAEAVTYARPDPSWTLESLATYAKVEVSHSAQAEQEAILQAHKSAVHLFRAGHALALARDKCKGEKHGEWKKFKKKHDWADSTVNDAIRLYENAKTEDALAGLGITEAKKKYVYPPKAKSSTFASLPGQHAVGVAGKGAATATAKPGADTGAFDASVPEAQAGAAEGQQESADETDASSSSGEEESHTHDDDAPETDKTVQTLADELESIAQRLSGIALNEIGKVSWSKPEHGKATNAVAAMKKTLVIIQKKLKNEDAIA